MIWADGNMGSSSKSGPWDEIIPCSRTRRGRLARKQLCRKGYRGLVDIKCTRRQQGAEISWQPQPKRSKIKKGQNWQTATLGERGMINGLGAANILKQLKKWHFCMLPSGCSQMYPDLLKGERIMLF